MAKTFRVLSIDGGSMRGLYSASLLSLLSEYFAKTPDFDLGKNFNLITGSSSGSIIACGLASGLPIDTIKNIFIWNGAKIFTNPMPEPGNFKFYKWALKHSFRNTSKKDELKKALFHTFGESTLHEVYNSRKIALAVPALDALNFKPKVFRTPHLNKEPDYKLADVILSATAAPVLFPLHKITNGTDEYLIDGAFWMNNPLLLGLSEALSLSKKEDEIEIISIGSGNNTTGKEDELNSSGWGMLKWAKGMRLVELLLSSQAYGHTYIAQNLAEQFRKLGKKVDIVRLDETLKTPGEFQLMHADCADSSSVNMILSAAERDASFICDNLSEPDRKVLQGAFNK
jgi:uncharacterized protein